MPTTMNLDFGKNGLKPFEAHATQADTSDNIFYASLLVMKIYLDDERVAPEGWLQVRWPNEVITLLESGCVTHLSLDHDLGDDKRGTGYDVLQWIEQQVFASNFIPPQIIIHTANPPARKRMLEAVESTQRIIANR